MPAGLPHKFMKFDLSLTDGETGKKTAGQADRQTDRTPGRQANRQADRHRQTDGLGWIQFNR